MTALTDRARAEAERRTMYSPEKEYQHLFVEGAEWGRVHTLAELHEIVIQATGEHAWVSPSLLPYFAIGDPTEAEVEAATRVIFMAEPSRDGTIAAWAGFPEHVKNRCLQQARAALLAARDARRAEG